MRYLSSLFFLVAIICSLFFSSGNLSAQIPRTLSYQGILTDSLGNPKADASYSLTFKIYDVQTSGSALWTETKSLSTKKGLFSTILGDVTPFGSTTKFDKPYWLGIQVGSNPELSPRIPLTAVGFSFNSIYADTAKYADTTRIASTVANNSITTAKILNGSISFADIGQNGATTGQVMKWNGTTWGPRNDSAGTLGVSSQWTTLGSDIYYNLGNVGIGDTNYPSYKLDILHGGSTGIRSRSSASFSVVDIDAASGDAALRFMKAGVSQWNIRNRPGDDYLEFFELGGGGSRMVIQDATGNIGIGETTSPSYKLDVLHGGSTGIRSRSSASFSVVDIDAASGDAALRFQKAGIGMWNIRNRPYDNYLEIFELGGGGSRMVIQDSTGNVGIGETTAPTYKLDILHGGGTGARIKSATGSANYSTLDIDADNGDASVRFLKGGLGTWDVRNRPTDDYFEIFETGSSSRMVIQDGTGNVGIGETTAPAYKLDVLHAGATGIRSRSSSTFSVVDIDANNGDAALRFQKAGVGQWNIRNNPSTDDLQFFELGGGGERMRIENTTGRVVVDADLAVIGTLSKAAGSFKIDHPIDPENKYLYHSFVESPDMMNIYNGNIVTDGSGKATVTLPDYFEALNQDFRYQLTVIGSFAQAIISRKVDNNQFEIATNQPNIEVSWQVTGVRHDAFANKNRIQTVVDKEPENRGKYLHPEAFNLPVARSINISTFDESENTQSSVNQVSMPVLKSQTIINESSGSIIPPKASTSATKPIDRDGSVTDTTPAKIESKSVDAGGSVGDEPKKDR